MSSAGDRMSNDMPTKIFDLPDIVLTQHILQSFAATPQDIVAFGSTCRAAHRIANTPSLWALFCQYHVSAEVAKAFTDFAVWGAVDFQHLWIGLLQPYGHLLGRLWHSATWPSGLLLHVDVEPPRLVARSLYYKSLNGGPYCHDVFSVELPQGTQAKAVVTCWRDKHSANKHESVAELRAVSASSNAGDGTADASNESSSVVNVSSDCQQPEGFMLCCKGHCDSMVSEFTSRRLASKAYATVRQQFMSGTAASSTSSNANSSESNSSNGEAAVQQTSVQQQRLPLPDVQPSPTIDFIHFISLSDMLPSFAPPVFMPLDLGTWRHSATTAKPANSSTAALPLLAARADSSSSIAQRAADTYMSGAALPSAASLAGLWRGTYGSHGIELVQLQLLQAPVDFFLCGSNSSSSSAAAIAADAGIEAVHGVLLSGVGGCGTPTGSAAAAAPAEQATGPSVVQIATEAAVAVAAAVGLPVAAAPAAVAAAADELNEMGTNFRQHQQHGGEAGRAAADSSTANPVHQEQPASVLLVATKLTGDMNVPAARATFAADLSCRSTDGAGAALQLPAVTDTDVPLNRATTRPLIVKERYRARAQIAFTNFQSPSIIAAELVVFDDPDCLGLVWKRPVNSFSLFSRVEQLPGLDV